MSSPAPSAGRPGGFAAALGRLLDRRAAAALPPPAAPRPPEPAGGDPGRRDRRLALPMEIIDRGLSAKVLHGWLQNRHQVLVPLTLRLGRLDADDVGLIMRFAAAALLNASTADDAARRSLERWLAGAGADSSALERFRAAAGEPEPLSALVAAVRERNLAAYAYAAAVAAADTREPSGRLFANYVAARLALSADAVRSVDRRYRR